MFSYNRLMFGFIYAGLVWVTPRFQNEDGQFPFYYYALVIIIYAVHQVFIIRFKVSFIMDIFKHRHFILGDCVQHVRRCNGFLR